MSIQHRAMRRLLVVSHVVHYNHGGRLYAYGPYMRELELWADLFHEVIIAAPCRPTPPMGDCLPCLRPNVTMAPQLETGGLTLRAKVVQLLSMPRLVADLLRQMRRADAIHVRCPGNLGLLGALLAPLFPVPRIAKYAGQWVPFPGEAWTMRLQRRVLASRWWDAPVTVYGTWPGQPPQVIPFFTSMLSSEQMERAARAARRPRPSLGRLLYVGRLAPEKNVDVLLAAVARLRDRGLRVSCTLVGDGPERAALEAQMARLRLEDRVSFTGAVPFDAVLDQYEAHDVLVLASETEGWPKAIAEAMAFGLLCIGSDRGFVREMLAERGITVPPGNVVALAEALAAAVERPADQAALRANAAVWGQRHSLQDLGRALGSLLLGQWRVRLDGVVAPRSEHPARP